jgi:hypothetical protein
MLIRYHWGLGVGHTYTHQKTKTSLGDDRIDHDDGTGEDDEWIGCAGSDDSGDDETAIFEGDSDVDSEILEIYGW